MANIIKQELIVANKLSKKKANELLFYFIRWGQHRHHHLRRLSDADIISHLKEMRYPMIRMINELKENPHKAIYEFENLLIGGTSEVSSSSTNIKVKVSSIIDGVEVLSSTMQGTHMQLNDHGLSAFQLACKHRDLAIRNNSFEEFKTAVIKGIISIEGFLNTRAIVYNAKCKKHEELNIEDRRIRLDDKLKSWLETMSGYSIDKKCKGWQDFKTLQRIRNDQAVHNKMSSPSITMHQLAEYLNMFRTGIGSTVVLLHQAFNTPMQSNIIRAMKYPDVSVVDVMTR